MDSIETQTSSSSYNTEDQAKTEALSVGGEEDGGGTTTSTPTNLIKVTNLAGISWHQNKEALIQHSAYFASMLTYFEEGQSQVVTLETDLFQPAEVMQWLQWCWSADKQGQPLTFQWLDYVSLALEYIQASDKLQSFWQGFVQQAMKDQAATVSQCLASEIVSFAKWSGYFTSAITNFESWCCTDVRFTPDTSRAKWPTEWLKMITGQHPRSLTLSEYFKLLALWEKPLASLDTHTLTLFDPWHVEIDVSSRWQFTLHQFKIWWAKFSLNFLEHWPVSTEGAHVMAAGGAVLSGMLDLPRNHPAVQHADIDLFILGTSEPQKRALLHTLMTHLDQLLNEVPRYWIVRASVVTLVSPLLPRHIQIIYSSATTCGQILCGFDIDAVQVGYDGTQVMATAAALRSWWERTVYVAQTPVRIARLGKIIRRGFELASGITQLTEKECLAHPETRHAFQQFVEVSPLVEPENGSHSRENPSRQRYLIEKLLGCKPEQIFSNATEALDRFEPQPMEWRHSETKINQYNKTSATTRWHLPDLWQHLQIHPVTGSNYKLKNITPALELHTPWLYTTFRNHMTGSKGSKRVNLTSMPHDITQTPSSPALTELIETCQQLIPTLQTALNREREPREDFHMVSPVVMHRANGILFQDLRVHWNETSVFQQYVTHTKLSAADWTPGRFVRLVLRPGLYSENEFRGNAIVSLFVIQAELAPLGYHPAGLSSVHKSVYLTSEAGQVVPFVAQDFLDEEEEREPEEPTKRVRIM